MTDLRADLTEVVAIHVAERFSGPPWIRVLALDNPELPVMLPANHIVQLVVEVQTHFGTLIRGELIHGWHKDAADMEAVLSAVDLAVDQALAKKEYDHFKQNYPDVVAWWDAMLGDPFKDYDPFDLEGTIFDEEEDDDG